MGMLDEIAKSVTEGVDDGIGFAIIDIESGLLLGAHHTIPQLTQTFLEIFAAAAVDMFRGRNVSNVEQLLREQLGSASNTSFIREIQVTTDKAFLFFSILPNKPNTLAVLVTGRRANLGFGWSAVRQAIPQIEPFVP